MNNTAVENHKRRSSFLVIFCALLKNKLRFDAKVTSNKKVLLFVLFALFYLCLEVYAVMTTVSMGSVMAANGGLIGFFVLLMAIGGAVVLVFGIFNFISTLFLSKDGEFFSALPVKPHIVFASKLLYVYLSDAAILIAALFPVIITLGVVAKVGAVFYIVSLLTLPLVPALPLAIAAVFALPIMYLASKARYRNAVLFTFYSVLFLAVAALYAYFAVYTNKIADMEFGEEQAAALVQSFVLLERILYPYAALSRAAFAVSAFGLSVGLSVAVNLLIFILCNVFLVVILIALGKTMYDQSYKANGQTDNSKKKVVKHKSSGMMWALIKREFVSAMRTPSVAFQCFVVYALPIMFAVIFSFTMPNMLASSNSEVEINVMNILPLIDSVVLMTISATINAPISSFSREGVGLGFVKALPVSGKQIVKAKILAWIIPCVIASLISCVIVSVINYDTLNFVLSLLAFMWMPVVYAVFAVLWDLRSPKLIWTDPMQAVKHNMHATIGMYLCMIPGFCLTIFSIVLLVFPLPTFIMYNAYWAFAYVTLVVFVVIDILLYKNCEKNYSRLEF